MHPRSGGGPRVMLGIESVQTDGHRDAARLARSRRVLAEGWFGGHGGRADCGQAESPEESSSVAPHGDLPFHGGHSIESR